MLFPSCFCAAVCFFAFFIAETHKSPILQIPHHHALPLPSVTSTAVTVSTSPATPPPDPRCQAGASPCGVACTATVPKSTGALAPNSNIRMAFPASYSGLNPASGHRSAEQDSIRTFRQWVSLSQGVVIWHCRQLKHFMCHLLACQAASISPSRPLSVSFSLPHPPHQCQSSGPNAL